MCVCVCLSVKSDLASAASVRPEITATDSAGRCFLKLLCSRATAIPALYGYRAVGHFLTAEYDNTCMSLPSYK